jgi:ABC-type long-subunit fatty acid transport system fused permease/ATPase subunit
MGHDEAEASTGGPQRRQRANSGIIEIIGATGAVLVVALGLVFVFIDTLVSLGTVPGNQKAAFVTAAFTIFGTIVGAYFGVKVGSAGKEQAEAARQAATVKVEELAARADPKTVEQALDKVQERLAAEHARSGRQPPTVL